MKSSAVVLVLLSLGLVLGGCGGGENGEQATQTAGENAGAAASANGVDRYTVRGEINKLPDADGPDKSLYIRHAAIPDYKNADRWSSPSPCAGSRPATTRSCRSPSCPAVPRSTSTRAWAATTMRVMTTTTTVTTTSTPRPETGGLSARPRPPGG